MPIFISQGRYTREGIAGMVARPEDREVVAKRLLEAAGGRLLGYYMTFGEYDYIVISELPDSADAMAVLLTAANGGGITDQRTMLAMTTAEAKEAMGRAAGLAAEYRAPGKAG